jgi:hypothetical protein
MTGKGIVRVLVVSESSREFLAFRQFFQRYECQCHHARSYKAIGELLDAPEFDIVLSTDRIPGERIHRLFALLLSSRASAFYSLRVHRGYWWLPVLRFGKKCFGTPALRGNQFVDVLDRLVKEITADFHGTAIASQSLRPSGRTF